MATLNLKIQTIRLEMTIGLLARSTTICDRAREKGTYLHQALFSGKEKNLILGQKSVFSNFG